MAAAKVLLAEDDEAISTMMTKSLKKEGFETYCAYDGQEALDIWRKIDFQLVILDVMLPNMDGMEVMRRIREQSKVPILIVSAKAEENDRVIGLGLGADDYLVKPFSLAELIARVKAQLRRYLYYSTEANIRKNEIVYGDIKLDLDNYTVVKNGKTIPLRAREYEIVKLFFQHPNKVFTKAQLFSAVWGEQFMGDDNTVMVHINRVRNKIEDNSGEPRYIQTVWGIGYRLGSLL